MFFTQYFPFPSGSVPFTIPCYFCHCVQAQIPLFSQLGSDQPVPGSIDFSHTALFRQNHATHFVEPLNWSYLQFCTLTSAKKLPTILVISRWLDHLFATWDSRLFCRVSFVRSACNSTYFFPGPHHLDVKFCDNHARSVSLNTPRFMSASPPEPELPPVPYASTCIRRGCFGCGKQLRSRSFHN